VTGGRIKAATASQPKKKLSIELGGKNAGIVFFFLISRYIISILPLSLKQTTF